jgi:uncharacterized membrane protein
MKKKFKEGLRYVFTLGFIFLFVAVLLSFICVNKDDPQSTPIALSLVNSLGYMGALSICVSGLLIVFFPLSNK